MCQVFFWMAFNGLSVKQRRLTVQGDMTLSFQPHTHKNKRTFTHTDEVKDSQEIVIWCVKKNPLNASVKSSITPPFLPYQSSKLNCLHFPIEHLYCKLCAHFSWIFARFLYLSNDFVFLRHLIGYWCRRRRMEYFDIIHFFWKFHPTHCSSGAKFKMCKYRMCQEECRFFIVVCAVV